MSKVGDRVWNLGVVERVVKRDRGIRYTAREGIKEDGGFKKLLEREMNKYTC